MPIITGPIFCIYLRGKRLQISLSFTTDHLTYALLVACSKFVSLKIFLLLAKPWQQKVKSLMKTCFKSVLLVLVQEASVIIKQQLLGLLLIFLHHLGESKCMVVNVYVLHLATKLSRLLHGWLSQHPFYGTLFTISFSNRPPGPHRWLLFLTCNNEIKWTLEIAF